MNKKIRSSKENTKKSKKGEPEAFELINKEEDKFPKKILTAGGISYYDLIHIISVEGTMTDYFVKNWNYGSFR